MSKEFTAFEQWWNDRVPEHVRADFDFLGGSPIEARYVWLLDYCDAVFSAKDDPVRVGAYIAAARAYRNDVTSLAALDASRKSSRSVPVRYLSAAIAGQPLSRRKLRRFRLAQVLSGNLCRY